MKRLALLAFTVLLPGRAWAAASYDLLPFEKLTADHRVLIGVPSGFEDLLGQKVDGRGAFRRAEVEKAVGAHLERMAAESDSLALEAVQYSFVTHQEAAFPDLFPKHTRHTAQAHGLDAPLATPALKLINVRTKETMYPDWPILLADFPAELDRLVEDFERWQTQSEASRSVDADGVLSLNVKNAAAAAAEFRATVTLFYAPWCHYSQLMLPLFGEAARLVAAWEAAGWLAPRALRLAHVNVDHEGELRALHNVTTYPQVHVLTGQPPAGRAVVAARLARPARPAASPSVPFGGSAATGADVASHAASVYAWASRQPFALLAAPAAPGVGGGAAAPSNTDSAAAFAGLALAADAALVAGAKTAAAQPPPKDDEPGVGEVHKRAVAVLVVWPDDARLAASPAPGLSSSSSSSSSSSAAAVAQQVATLVGGGHVFVGSGGGAACADAAAALLQGTDATAAPAAAHGGSLAAAAAACAEFGHAALHGGSGGGVVVVHPSDGAVLARRWPSTGPGNLEGGGLLGAAEQGGGMAAWLRAAAWPALSRFSTSAEQGERIRKSGMSTLCLLVGDEGDFMFEDFKQALAGAARAHVGAAHFLFANAATEPRVGALVTATRAAWPRGPGAPPVLLLVSMAGGFAPRKLEGPSITTRGVLALLDAAAAEEGHPRLHAGAPGEF